MQNERAGAELLLRMGMATIDVSIPRHYISGEN
jgi:hypothetical protein